MFIFSQLLLKYQQSVRNLVEESVNEIESYCTANSWISEIKKYISNYSSKLVLEWKAAGSIEIEEQLNRIRNWIDLVKTGIEKTIITRNRLFKVECKQIEDILVPKLEAIFNEICECILAEVNKDTGSFNEFISKVIKVTKTYNFLVNLRL